MRKTNGSYQVFENGEFFTDVTFYKRPQFYDRQWSANPDDENQGTVFIDEGMSGLITPHRGGLQTAAGDLFDIESGKFPYLTLACYNGLVIWLSWGCLYNKQGKACRFCCLPGEYRDSKLLINQPGWLEGLVDTVEQAFNELGPDIKNCSLTVDAGTFPGRDKGAWAYVKTMEAIKQRFGGQLPDTIYIRAVIEPPYD